MFKVILFSALLCAVYATNYHIPYETVDEKDHGLTNEYVIRPHYMKPIYQSHVAVEYNDEDGQDLAVEDEPGEHLEQKTVDAFPKHSSYPSSKIIPNSYKGSDISGDIKHKKHSYEATKITQEEVEVKSLNNPYGSRLPHKENQDTPKVYKGGKHTPPKGIYSKKPVEQGHYSQSIGQKNDPHTSNYQPASGYEAPVQEHVEANFKVPSIKSGSSKFSSHTPSQQAHYETGIRPSHYGHQGGYKGYSNYKSKDAYMDVMLNHKPNSVSSHPPQTYGIYREGPKKHSSTYHSSEGAGLSSYQGSGSKPYDNNLHSSGPSSHRGYHSANSEIGNSGGIISYNSLGGSGSDYSGIGGISSNAHIGQTTGHNSAYGGTKSSGGYHHGIKSSGGYGPSSSSHLQQNTDYKGYGVSSRPHHLGGGSNLGHYDHGQSNTGSSAYSGHHTQPKYTGSSIVGHGHQGPAYNNNHGSGYSSGIGSKTISGIGQSSLNLGYNTGYGSASHGYNPSSIKSSYGHQNTYGNPGSSLGGISNVGHSAYPGKKHSPPSNHYSGSSASGYHHSTHNIKKDQYHPKPIKSSGTKHSYPGSSFSSGLSYSDPKIPSGYHGSSPGLHSAGGSKPAYSGEYRSKESYHQSQISQEKHIDHYDSPKKSYEGTGQSSYHGIGESSPSYPKSQPALSKPHYKTEQYSKPSVGSIKSGHHASKQTPEYHGIGESNYQSPNTHAHKAPEYHGLAESKPQSPNNHGIPKSPYAMVPISSKGHSHKRPSGGSGIKGGSPAGGSDYDNKKYLPVTASSSNGYSGGSDYGNKKYLPVTASHSNGYSGGSDHGNKKYLPVTASQSNGYSGGSDHGNKKYLPVTASQSNGYSGGSDHGNKKYLPDTSSYSSGYNGGSYEQPLKGNSDKYEPFKIEQKDIGYEALLGGHGSQSPGSATGGYGSSSSGSPSSSSHGGYGSPSSGSPSSSSLGGHGSSSSGSPSSSSHGGYGSSSSGSPSSSSHGGYGSSSSGSPSSSSHDVYGSDDEYEMSKPMPYEFKYDVKDDEHGAEHYREEKMDDNGYLTGRYGYKDAHGLYRQVEYEASKEGFKVSSIKTNEPGTDNKDPADVHFEVERNNQSHY